MYLHTIVSNPYHFKVTSKYNLFVSHPPAALFSWYIIFQFLVCTILYMYLYEFIYSAHMSHFPMKSRVRVNIKATCARILISNTRSDFLLKTGAFPQSAACSWTLGPIRYWAHHVVCRCAPFCSLVPRRCRSKRATLVFVCKK